LEISALGSGRVERDGKLIGPAEWGYAKPRELLYYLLEFPDRTKEQVGTDLWPWASSGSLRNSFHATLHALRRALGRADRIVFRAGRYAFNRSLSYSYDVERFETARAAAAGLTDEAAISALRVVVASYGGDYLPDLEGADWIDVRRIGLRRSYESALLSLGRLQIAGSDLLGAIETYQRAIAHDRLLESAHRELVRCYARQGERGLAVRHGRTLVALLRDELGVPPGPETAELLTRLRRGEPV
jgi:DNA-binding SARP family transcriptional activator